MRYLGAQSEMERKENKVIKEAQRLRKPAYSTQNENCFWKKGDFIFKNADFELTETRRWVRSFDRQLEMQNQGTLKRSEVQVRELRDFAVQNTEKRTDIFCSACSPTIPSKGATLIGVPATDTLSLNPQPKLIRFRVGTGQPKVNPQSGQSISNPCHLPTSDKQCQSDSLSQECKEAQKYQLVEAQKMS